MRSALKTLVEDHIFVVVKLGEGNEPTVYRLGKQGKALIEERM
jgi:hypothetical protein